MPEMYDSPRRYVDNAVASKSEVQRVLFSESPVRNSSDADANPLRRGPAQARDDIRPCERLGHSVHKLARFTLRDAAAARGRRPISRPRPTHLGALNDRRKKNNTMTT